MQKPGQSNEDRESQGRQEIKDLLELIHQERQERLLERTLEKQEREQEKNKYRETILHHQKKDFWWKYLSFLLGLLIAALGYYFLWSSSLDQDRQAAEREYKQHQADIIRADINEKKEMLKAGVMAMREMRTINYKILLRCKYNHPYSMEEQQWLRRLGSDKVIKTFTLAPYVFNEAVGNSIVQFIGYSDKQKDLCQITDLEQYDTNLQSMQDKTRNLMAKAIKENIEKLENLS